MQFDWTSHHCGRSVIVTGWLERLTGSLPCADSYSPAGISGNKLQDLFSNFTGSDLGHQKSVTYFNLLRAM